ncbi:MAG: hypothetical protein KAI64_06715 [Thermoplasmata archaeon]|nr:hypothetical protein [Thermoplasmata archaeon]
MSEQPENPQEQQAEQQQAPFPQAGMQFYVKLDDLPSASTYMQPLSLHRFEAKEGSVIMERFDKEGRRWVDNPNLIAATGIGGDESYSEIDEEEANRLIAMWTPADAEAEDADAEPVAEEEGEVVEGEVEESVGEVTAEGDNREIPEYDFDWRPQEGEDHSDQVVTFLDGLIEVEETVEEDEEEEPEEQSFSVRGLLRRIFNVK